ncbi:hypothetical protein HFD92_17100 [Pantoea sp. EKM101V]|uniref:hypothetical protein n=1 Tax=Pantoea sp. EKM101V TaxID=1683695 RepID=UPI00142DE340|nr:hypothetical protein [Pantoea sp. EKM101V]KAF6661967.1 hypothetical protein HFD92_17100 [Pantoea sp. EKM101V]
MRLLNISEAKSVSGADIGYTELLGMWNEAGLNSDCCFNYNRAAKSINAIGLASATEYKSWNNASMGEAGWMLNEAGEKVTWFNNGLFIAFQVS